MLLEGLDADIQQTAAYTARVAEKIGSALTEEYVLGAVRHHGSASIGIHLVADGDDDPDHILKEADAAMYQAKAKRLCGADFKLSNLIAASAC